MNYRNLIIEDYDQFIDLLISTEGVSNREADSRESIEKYLDRNTSHSFCALDGSFMVGCALCGHDSRRGYLQHVMVRPKYRKQGIAQELIRLCLDKLEDIGIYKTHIDVFKTNSLANDYWAKNGWTLRNDINRYSFNRSNNENI